MPDFVALKVKEANQDQLLKNPNVIGTGVGNKIVDGNKKSAIIVFVEQKLPEDEVIAKYSAEELIPQTLQGIPTKIIEVGKIIPQAFKERVRPIRPGYSAGHSLITAGTIGGIFKDKDGDIVALSNNHVFAAENKALIGDPIYQPGRMDAQAGSIVFTNWDQPVSDKPYFGTLKRFMALNRSNNLHDSAIAKIHPTYINSGLIDARYPQLDKPLAGIASAAINQDVQKCGRTTGLTTGKVIALHGSFTIGYEFGQARFNDCIVLSGMSAGGDSGSVIMDKSMNAVGLLFAGSGKVTLASPIQYVISEYGLTIYNDQIKTQSAEQTKDWSMHSANGVVIGTPATMTVKSNNNSSCYVERKIDRANSISVKINTMTDKDTDFGPSLALIFDGNFIKLTLNSEGATLSTKDSLVRSELKPLQSTEYLLRIRNRDNVWSADILDDTDWVSIGSVAVDADPVMVRIGKLDRSASCSSEQGSSQVSSYYSDFKIS
jgi:hypothetical protein